MLALALARSSAGVGAHAFSSSRSCASEHTMASAISSKPAAASRPCFASSSFFSPPRVDCCSGSGSGAPCWSRPAACAAHARRQSPSQGCEGGRQGEREREIARRGWGGHERAGRCEITIAFSFLYSPGSGSDNGGAVRCGEEHACHNST